MTSFVLKMIALISMTFDHVGYTFFKSYTWFNIVGKIAFPIFAFQISEGYLHTKDLKKYCFRLLIFAILSQAPFMLFVSTFSNDYLSLNIFFTLLLGLLTITLFDQCKNKYIGWASVIAIATIAQLIHCDYGWYGIAIIFLFYYLKEKPKLLYPLFVILTSIKYLWSCWHQPTIFYLYFAIGTFLSLVPIHFYQGKQGKRIQYLLYIYYPLHILVLYFIRLFFIK